jgi:hypothetical protein
MVVRAVTIENHPILMVIVAMRRAIKIHSSPTTSFLLGLGFMVVIRQYFESAIQ